MRAHLIAALSLVAALALSGCTTKTVMTGTVTGPQGPMVGAEVTLAKAGDPATAAHATTGVGGHFVVTLSRPIWRTMLRLTVAKDGYHTLERTFSSNDPIATVADIKLEYSADMVAARNFVEEYFKYETAGGMLTDDGWKNGQRFFLKPLPSPDKKSLVLVDDYYVEQPVLQPGEHPQVLVSVSPGGELDPQLRYRTGELAKSYKAGLIIQLAKASGSSEWKVDNTAFADSPWVVVNRQMLMDYLRTTRDTSRDPKLRKNAAATIAVLQHQAGLPPGPCGGLWPYPPPKRKAKKQAATEAPALPCGQ